MTSNEKSNSPRPRTCQNQLGALGCWLVRLRDVPMIACEGPNYVSSYDPARQTDEGKLIPEHRTVCCQDAVELDADEKIIDQRTSRSDGGQLHLTVTVGDLGAKILEVTQWLDEPDPIPAATTVVDATGRQVFGFAPQAR